MDGDGDGVGEDLGGFYRFGQLAICQVGDRQRGKRSGERRVDEAT